MILIVAGVSGSGKTTVGERLGQRLGWPFADADGFHPAANVAKMHAGIPLTDADRMPWLGSITAWMDERIAAGESAVVSCSALRRSYRSLLLSGRPGAVMVFLRVGRDELRHRLATREGHFFEPELLDSQLATLEPPEPDEGVLSVPSEPDPAETVARVIKTLTSSGHTLGA
ncbi:MAG: gluconokinase [Nocardiopsaceae bacterium]|nr:gluconokinase [Nocardiopsaceae bacterium]